MEGTKLYVGNLNYAVTIEDLKEAFGEHGEVKDVTILEGRGFGFVEMGTPDEAEKAKEALNETDFKGRTLKIDEARPMKKKPRRDFGGGGSGGGGGGGRRY